MTVPGSPRLPYDQLPAGLRTAIDAALGSPVVHVSPRTGGFSPGPAVVVTCADGGRAFVKAVGTPLNPDTPALLRTEAAVTAALPAGLPAPRLRAHLEWAEDADEWVALVFDEVDGACPTLPWTAATATRVLTGVSSFAERATPCPVAELPSLDDRLTQELTAWPLLRADPPADLDPWEADRLDWLAEVPARLAGRGGLTGDTLVHLDLRADNLLLRPDGELVLLDWAWAARGPAWVDPVLLSLDMAVHGGLDPATLATGLPAVAAADPADVTDLLLVLTGMWALTMRAPAPPGIPTLRAFQRRFHGVALHWARSRLAEEAVSRGCDR
ncbi:phosphotransferase [Modestobacter sp. VKM Ac-2977]|uniref:phosphotransferase family protein n=1 Tax=Modestobacter sp. VKM Ac-2977 TaxID=3004131 RepID=UPI0022AABAF6|nr:phosphotransferase [Modestobacter sp. VKM Ac-2977]MCZ2819677.1 phosphotransferase [Modestobacter sp. VKM Ac-2977]